MNRILDRVSHGLTRGKVLKIKKDSDEFSRLRCKQKLSKARKVRNEVRRFFKSEDGESSFELSEALSKEDGEAIFTDALYDEFEEHCCAVNGLPNLADK
jgi:hypothetical protein